MPKYVDIGNGYLSKSKYDKGAPYYGKISIEIPGTQKIEDAGLGGWIKEGKDGGKFFSLKISVPEDHPLLSSGGSDNPPGGDDEVPF